MGLALFIGLSLIAILSGAVCLRPRLNPLTIFGGIWLVIVLLYQLRLSGLQERLGAGTYVLLCLSTLFFTLAFYAGYRFRKNKTIVIAVSPRSLDGLFLSWALCSAVEIVYSGGLPIVWLITHSSKNYFDFGIPTLHGCLCAVGLVLASAFFYRILEGSPAKKKYVLYIVAILLFYLCLITRQVIICACIQFAVIYLIKREVSLLSGRMVLIVVGFVVAFGLIGNARTGYETFMLRAQLEGDLPSWLSGLYWVYVYLTMILANVNSAVVQGMGGASLQPLVDGIVPTILQEMLQVSHFPKTYLVDANFTTGGYFIKWYLAFGIIGVPIAATLYGLLGGIAFKNYLQNGSEKNIILYSIAVQIIAMSFFSDMLLYLPDVFQIAIVVFLYREATMGHQPSTRRRREEKNDG